MKILRYTLLSDGSSDRCLIPIINWLLSTHFPHVNFEPQFANNLGEIGYDLSKRAQACLRLFPCDFLFVHRDAERSPLSERIAEIERATQNLGNIVPIVPIRMSEAWLFSDENAIREATGNPAGKVDLDLPSKREWERLPDPKERLFAILRLASGKSGRSLSKFNPAQHRNRISELTNDFSNLRGVPSFDHFEQVFLEILGNL